MRLNHSAFYGVLALTIGSLFFAALQYFVGTTSPEGLFVVDSVSLKRSLLIYDIFHQGISFLFSTEDEIGPFVLLFFLYYFTSLEYGYCFDFFTNITLISIAWLTTLKIGQKLNLNLKKIFLLGVIFWFFNPFILSQMLFPNKLIPLIFLTSIFCYGLFKRRYFSSIIILVLIFLLRDGYGLALCLALAVFLSLTKIKYSEKYFFWILISAVILAKNFDLSGLGGPFSRNADLYILHYQSLGNANFGAIYSWLYNWTTFAFRPQFFSSTSIYLINVGFWMFGILSFLVIPKIFSEFWCFRRSRSPAIPIIFCFFICLALSDFHQPRYLFPLLPLMIVCYAEIKFRYIWGLVILSLAINPLFYVVGLLPPFQLGLSVEQLIEIGFKK